LKFYYKKGKNATQVAKKFEMFMDIWIVSVRGIKLIQAFSIGNFDIKDVPRFVDQSLEKSLKSWKKLSKTSERH